MRARKLHAGSTDATLIDEALVALLARYRAAQTDAMYADAARRIHSTSPTTGETWRRFAKRPPQRDRDAQTRQTVESVSIAVLVERLGTLSCARMREICTALEVAVNCT